MIVEAGRGVEPLTLHSTTKIRLRWALSFSLSQGFFFYLQGHRQHNSRSRSERLFSHRNKVGSTGDYIHSVPDAYPTSLRTAFAKHGFRLSRVYHVYQVAIGRVAFRWITTRANFISTHAARETTSTFIAGLTVS